MTTLGKRLIACVSSAAMGLPVAALEPPGTTSLALGTVIAGQAFVQPVKAQPSASARERMIQQCMTLQNRYSHDGYEGNKSGGLQWHYQACMVELGERP